MATSSHPLGQFNLTSPGEYFTVIATCVFLPLEVYQLTEKVTAFRLLAFVINVAAVVWLLWSKWLFGLNGDDRRNATNTAPRFCKQWSARHTNSDRRNATGSGLRSKLVRSANDASWAA